MSWLVRSFPHSAHEIKATSFLRFRHETDSPPILPTPAPAFNPRSDAQGSGVTQPVASCTLVPQPLRNPTAPRGEGLLDLSPVRRREMTATRPERSGAVGESRRLRPRDYPGGGRVPRVPAEAFGCRVGQARQAVEIESSPFVLAEALGSRVRTAGQTVETTSFRSCISLFLVMELYLRLNLPHAP